MALEHMFSSPLANLYSLPRSGRGGVEVADFGLACLAQPHQNALLVRERRLLGMVSKEPSHELPWRL